jgi:hypothetical protein
LGCCDAVLILKFFYNYTPWVSLPAAKSDEFKVLPEDALERPRVLRGGRGFGGLFANLCHKNRQLFPMFSKLSQQKSKQTD